MNSIWNDVRYEMEPRGSVNEDLKTDVLVIGGGIAGILCAFELKCRGVDCILVEMGQVCGGTTKNTTAKLTAQHNLVYDMLIKRFGIEKAGRYYEANNCAIDRFKEMAAKIPCDFEEKIAYVYSMENREKMEAEAAAYDKLGIPYIWKENTPLPFPVCGAVGMTAQAQFHPLKFLKGLLAGITYYENTFVQDIEGNQAITQKGVITAEKIILATHYPLINIPGKYFMKMTQQRSYVIALENGPDVDGMYIDEAVGGFSFRNYKNMLLLGGGGHKTGKSGGGVQKLRMLANQAYPDIAERYAWAAQDGMTLDQMPYIGQHRHKTPNLYVAAGFNKWGMTGAMTSAMVLADLISNGQSDYEELFRPDRSMLTRQLAVNLASAGAGLLHPGKRCSHMGCGLKWNEQEQSYDCPCHGSRFDKVGRILNNPAKRGINVEK